MDDLEERLRSHAEAFEGLLSLIPAKHYYGEDTSDQWSRKKLSKEQRRANKRAKLDPENILSAKDVMDANERKRKQELAGILEADSDLDVAAKEKPREGLKSGKKSAKKQKLESSALRDSQLPADPKTLVEKSGDADLNQRKLEKKEKKEKLRKEKLEKQQRKTAAKKELAASKKVEKPLAKGNEKGRPAAHELDIEHDLPADIEKLDFSGIAEDTRSDEASTASATSPLHSPVSEASAMPSTSSSSSIVPPIHSEHEVVKAANDEETSGQSNEAAVANAQTEDSNSAASRKIKLPEVDHEVLRAKLHARIEQLRAARKADGLDGKPAKNRQELMEARRRKQELRKAHKKELRRQAKEDEKRAATEAELAQLRGSGSPLTPNIFSPRRDSQNNFTFGAVEFDDGQKMDSSLSAFIDPRKRKGPQDPKTALEAAKRKRERIAGLDEEKRTNIEEKDTWINANKRVHGEKIRDDASLLKKTLKRKEKGKKKSEKEWEERLEGVRKGKEIRQKKREDNLRKRREEKGGKGKKAGKSGKKFKKRAGFEGSFKGRSS